MGEIIIILLLMINIIFTVSTLKAIGMLCKWVRLKFGGLESEE